MPEFEAIAAAVLAASMVGLIIVTTRYSKFNFLPEKLQYGVRDTDEYKTYRGVVGVWPSRSMKFSDVGYVAKNYGKS